MLNMDYSAANAANDCLRYYKNRYKLQIVPADEDLALPLHFGQALHNARHLLATGRTLEEALQAIDADYGALFEQYALQETELVRTPYVARSLLHAYVTKYGEIADEHTEIGARLDMGSFIFHGRIDYVARISGMLSVVDLKTTSGTMWLPQPRLNWQLVGYAYAVRELTDLEPEQVAIDGLVLPRPNKAIRNNPPPEWEYALTLQDNLHMRTASIQPRDYEEWLRWLRHMVMLVEHCEETGEWPMRAPKACSAYGKVCPYDPLCKCPSEELEQRLVEALYTVKPWHPFEEV